MLHSDLASGRWFTLSLATQLGNIGSEVSRALKAKQAGNTERMMNAFERCLELFDLTIADPKHRYRRKEICRAREVVCDFFVGGNAYHSEGASLDRYFTAYALSSHFPEGSVS